MKKIVLGLSILLSLIFSTGISGENNEVQYEELALILEELEMFKGTDLGFELDREPTRVEAAVMFVRVLGAEQIALEMEYSHPFIDVPKWAESYVGYLYEEGYTNGVSDTKFGSSDKISANSYVTFLLRALGYDDSKGDFSWSEAVKKGLKVGLIESDDKYDEIIENTFLRDDVAYLSYQALSTKYKYETKRLIDVLIQEDLVKKSVVYKYGYWEEDVLEMSMTNNEDETIQFEIDEDVLRITGKVLDAEKNYFDISIMLDDEAILNSKIKKSASYDTIKGKIEIDDLEEGEIYEISVFVGEYEYGTFHSWIWKELYIKCDEDGCSFYITPVYYINQEEFTSDKYEGGYDTPSEHEELIQLTEIITKGLTSDYDKALAIHDWVGDNIYYNYDDYYGIEQGEISAIGTYETKKSVCQGYANLTAELMRTAGIPCKVVSGYALGISTGGVWKDEIINSSNTNHVWNEAYIDGRWVIIDVTWNSGNDYRDGEFEYEGIRYRKYFDTTIEYFSLDHKIVRN